MPGSSWSHWYSLHHDLLAGHEPRDEDLLESIIAGLIEEAGLIWSVVESIPVHTSIKLATAEAAQYIDAYKETIRTLAKVRIIGYPFLGAACLFKTSLRWFVKNSSTPLEFR